MHATNSMTISLIQPIIYQEPPFVYEGSAEAYQSALTYLDGAEVGTEVVIALTSTSRLLFVGAKGAPTPEERDAIERGEELPPIDGPYALEAGRYAFTQLAPPPSLDPIISLKRIAIDGPSRVYVRLLKESPLAIIAQVWIAL